MLICFLTRFDKPICQRLDENSDTSLMPVNMKLHWQPVCLEAWKQGETARLALFNRYTIHTSISSVINFLGSDQFPGNHPRFQEVTGPSQNIVRHIIPPEMLNFQFYFTQRRCNVLFVSFRGVILDGGFWTEPG